MSNQMMKWLLFFFCLPVAGFSQGVKMAGYDAFVKKHRIEMEPVPLLQTSAAKMAVAFSAVASDLFVQFTGAGWGAVTVDDGDDLLFQLTNDSTVTVKADGLQTFEPGIPQSTYRHRYRIAQAGVEALARNGIAGLRKFSFKEATDIKLPKEASAKLQRQSAAFLTELKKAVAFVPLKRIAAKDVLNHIGDSVEFCSRIYNIRPSAGEKAVVASLQADYSEPVVNLLIGEEDRPKFGTAPDADFINKEICVSGLLLLRNNVPTITVRSKEQLKEKPVAATTNK